MVLVSFKDGVQIEIENNNIKILSGSDKDTGFNNAMQTGNTGALAINLNDRLNGIFSEMNVTFSL